jgi:hypothetical protein
VNPELEKLLAALAAAWIACVAGWTFLCFENGPAKIH